MLRSPKPPTCTHTLTVLALGAWMRGCRSALLSPFQLRALGLLARIRPTCGLFLGFLEIRSAHRSNRVGLVQKRERRTVGLARRPLGPCVACEGWREPRAAADTPTMLQKKDRAPVKGERPIKTNRGLAREPILTTSILSRHYAYSENRTHRQAPKIS